VDHYLQEVVFPWTFLCEVDMGFWSIIENKAIYGLDVFPGSFFVMIYASFRVGLTSYILVFSTK
jgi:hypothetical protein